MSSRLSTRQSAAVVNGVVGLGIAQPVYEWARQQVYLLRLEWSGALVFVVAVQLLPVLILWRVRRRLTTSRPIFDILLGAVAIGSIAWQARAMLSGVQLIVADGTAAALAIGALLLSAFLRWRVTALAAPFAVNVGALAVVLPILFVWQETVGTAGTLTPARRSDSVLIVVLDELSLTKLVDGQGRIDAARLPGFAELSRRSLWFPQAIANYKQTVFSMSSMMNGRLIDGSDASGAVRLFEHAALLAALGQNGYTVHYASPYLGCPVELASCINYADAPLHLDVGERLRLLISHAYVIYSQRASDFYPWLPAHVRRTEAALLQAWPGSGLDAPGHATLLHLLLSHDPYVLDSQGQTVRNRYGAFQHGRDLAAVSRQYDMQIEWVDRVIGEFLRRLDQHGAGRTTLVVTADHGTCWTEACQGRRYVREVEPSLAMVPMFVAGPLVTPGVSQADYQHADLMATVLRALGLAGGAIDQPSPEGARPRPFYPEIANRRVDVGLPARSVPVF